MTFGPVRMAWPDVVTLDRLALLLALVAMFAMFRLHLDMLPTLCLSAMLGLLLKALV